MLIAILISLLVLAALAIAAQPADPTISQHAYNNRANDASGARQDHLA